MVKEIVARYRFSSIRFYIDFPYLFYQSIESLVFSINSWALEEQMVDRDKNFAVA